MSGVSFEQADQLREFLFTVIESLPTGILFADRQGSLLAANQQACRLLGVFGSSILQQSCWAILAQSLKMPEKEMARLKLPGGKILWVTDAGSPESEKRYFSIARNELKSPFLHISGFFLALEDVTYLTMVEAQVERQKRLSAMREMAVNMSQELKNPLGSLQLYASILQRELDNDPENQQVAARMIQAVRTIDYLLDNYVTYAAMPTPDCGAVVVSAWLEEMVSRLLELDKGRHVYTLKLQHGPATISGDLELLRQLALNIGVNAAESMAEGRELRIETRTLTASGAHPEFLEVRFVDQGEGIAPENLERIFDPFFTTKARVNGLGLAIAHYITEAHRGLIKVESSPGKGSIFTVLLPYEV